MIRLNKTTIFGIAIFTVILFTGIGYAFLSSNLSINGTVNVPKREIICKRATSLNNRKCEYDHSSNSNDYGCGHDGYAKGQVIYYGNSSTTPGVLRSGDAFDCNVTGTGYNNRFYYVTDLDSDNSYAVLIYSMNTKQKQNSSTGIWELKTSTPDNDSNGDGHYNYSTGANTLTFGPNNVRNGLPTTAQWPKVQLTSTNRAIKDDANEKYLDYDYGNRAARLITYSEIMKACPSLKDNVRKVKQYHCEYLVQNTGYAQTVQNFKGYWAETLYPAKDVLGESANKAFVVDGFGHCSYPVTYIGDTTSYWFGARPVIEVKKGQIDY